MSKVSDLWKLAFEFIQVNEKYLCVRSPQASKQ